MKLLSLCLTLLLASPFAFADDGALQKRDVSKTPDWDTEHTSLQHLLFYVPAQSSTGELVTIEYVTVNEVVDTMIPDLSTRNFARPLVAFYEDGPVEIPEDSGGFYGHGERDMYAAVSLDDGDSWKRANLSKSADKSSIRIQVPFKKKTKAVDYPGDVFRNFTTSAGNKVLAVWASRYCSGGNPNYAYTTDDDAAEISEIFASANVTEDSKLKLGDAEACQALFDPKTYAPGDSVEQCLYFHDYWHVAGSQSIKDFAEEDYPSVGQVPYACLWAARGTLEATNSEGVYDPEGDHHAVFWRQAERLTSGVRDVHRMEAACAAGAGCVITWQEDPEGLRPGKGEGPGEGWSGAIAHHETDIWYAWIDWDTFDLVRDDDQGDPIVPLALYPIDAGVPPVGVPFSMPVRLTDNAMCQADTNDAGEYDDPYCFMDFVTPEDLTGQTFCASTVEYKTDPPVPEGETLSMCVAEDGRLLRGNTASTRARTNLRGYDQDDDDVYDSAWLVMAYEESKGLGDEDDVDVDNEIDKVDMGKNIWYHTFDMFSPELVSQGMMLNQPAMYPVIPTDDINGSLGTYALLPDTENDAADYTTYDENCPSDQTCEVDFYTIFPDPIYGNSEVINPILDSTLYQTEIARRYSQITQTPAAVKNSASGTAAFLMFKQGIVRQGGPADVFARRMRVDPESFDPKTENPFDYANMDCENGAWLFTDGGNPRYVKGLCLSAPQNLSGTTLVNCGEDVVDECQPLDFPLDTLFADIDKLNPIDPDEDDADSIIEKMTEWRQCQDGVTFVPLTSSTDITPDFACDDDDIDDQSWENPYELSKGHRGFMKGDYIMVMYAWSPNWEANTMGHDNYNLYVRRSFDGGESWTTMPASFDGYAKTYVIPDSTASVKSCEWYGLPGGSTEYPACYEYVPDGFEQARNLSQITGTHETVLDPRFAPTAGDITGCLGYLDGVVGISADYCTGDYGDEVPYLDDATDKSRFFATFEAGDTEAVAAGGEAEPMDMFYARAIDFGDHYELAVELSGDPIIYPDEVCTTAGDCSEPFSVFDKLECTEAHAAEAALKTNPAGTLFYSIWNEWMEDDGEVTSSDATVRRTMELGDIETVDYGVTLASSGCGGSDDDGGDDDDKPGGGKGRNK